MKILKKFEKFEEKMNTTLEKLQKLFIAFFIWLIPQFVFDFYYKSIKFIKIKSLTYFEKSKAISLRTLEKGKATKAKVFAAIDRAQRFPYKEKTFIEVGKIQDFLFKTSLKSHIKSILKVLSFIITKFNLLIKRLNNNQGYIAIAVVLMIALGSYGIFESSQRVFLSEFNTREPASVQKYVKKPVYKRYEKRTLKVFNIKVPVFQESVSSIRSVTIDFTVRTDTRFARKYLEEFEYKLKDYFFLTVEPVISEFPIKSEGKDIIRDKIQRELNTFLKIHNVEGKVLEVKITYIIAS